MARQKIVDNYPFLEFFGTRPNIIDKERSMRYYMSMFFNRIQQMFRYDGLPDTLPARYLEMYLMQIGHCCITQVESGESLTGRGIQPGLYALRGEISGQQDAYYFPLQYVVANPYLKYYKTLDIGETCVLCRNNTYLMPLRPAIQRYSEMLVEADITLRSMTINARAPVAIAAKDDTAQKSAELFLKRLEDGKLGIIADNLVFEGVQALPFHSPGAEKITDIIELRQYYLGALYNELGVNANFNMKRESINNSETELNRDALFPLIDEMLESRREFAEECNRLYSTNISVSLSSTWEQEAEEAEAALDMMEFGGENGDSGSNDNSGVSEDENESGETDTEKRNS